MTSGAATTRAGGVPTPVEAVIPLAQRLSAAEHPSGRHREVLRGHAEPLFHLVTATTTTRTPDVVVTDAEIEVV
ncbi:hypothetical protein AB0K60_16350 [Thermopolyspora sp. NPDC052614]|uniref:hypothetical protein n=1 Tax=Thermopolyspora sp. NPDC052614 TaxID=3155682 RepID=UPI003437BE59